jgi:hypothetical protein
MRIAQPSILSLCTFRNHDYDSQRGNDPSPIREVRVLDYPVPAGRGNRAGGELGCPKSLSKNMLKVAVFIVPFLLPPDGESAHDTRGSPNLD